nr:hypothetical protein [Methylomicrobium agile]
MKSARLKAGLKPFISKLKRLKKEVARLTEERDLLKKAAAYFAREQR